MAAGADLSERLEKMKLDAGGRVRALVMENRPSGEKREVYIVGESGNFTFSLALAALRGSWRGIISTSFDHNNILSRFAEMKRVALGWCILNQKKDCVKMENLGDLEKLAGLANILSLENPTERNIRRVVDCTRCVLPATNTIVWFQCPWKHKQTTTLLKKFFKNMKRQQDAGSYVLIGITHHRMYIESYDLDKMSEWCEGFEYVGEDREFIQEVLKHGYKHQCDSPVQDIHDIIFRHHSTLIFRKI